MNAEKFKMALDKHIDLSRRRAAEEPKLTRLTNDLDQLHSEMPDLLRDPSLTEKQYEMLHAAYDRISEAMKIMIDAGRIKND